MTSANAQNSISKYHVSVTGSGFTDGTLVRNVKIYLHHQITMRYLNPRLRYYYFRFLKTDVRHIGIIYLVSIFTYLSSLAWHFALAYQISSKSNNGQRSYDVISIFSDGGHRVPNLPTYCCCFSDGTHLWMLKSICTSNFNETSQSMADILLLPVSENGRLPYWNYISDFDFYPCLVIGCMISMTFCISIPKFIQVGQHTAELWRHIEFSRL